MKNLSLVLNGILAIAVGILFYQVNSLKKGTSPSTSSSETTSEKEAVTDSTKKAVISIDEIGPSDLKDAKIAYINIDSINLNYLYIADYSKKMKGQIQVIQNQLENLTMAYQTELQAYQESAQRGIAPQSELQKAEESLIRKEQDIKNKQVQLQNIQYDQQDKNYELNETLQQVVDKYNNGRFDYVISYSETLPILVFKNKKLDISADIIKILNDEYTAKKDKKK